MKKINTNKKIYSKPELEVVSVDHKISLVMESVPGNDPFSAKEVDPTSGPSKVLPPSEINDPFGGSTPSY